MEQNGLVFKSVQTTAAGCWSAYKSDQFPKKEGKQIQKTGPFYTCLSGKYWILSIFKNLTLILKSNTDH